MKTYTKNEEIHPCKLDKNDLLELIAIINEGISGSSINDFELSTNLPNISISSNNVEDFLKNKELPNKFNKLSIRFFGKNQNREIDKYIYVNFSVNYVDLNIDGLDQTWVLGKYSQITDFLRGKKPWFWALNKIFPYSMGVFPIVSLFGFIHFVKANEIVYSISMGIFLISFILASFFYFKGTFLPYTQIIIKSKESFFSKENINIIIAVLSLVVSITGVFIK